MNTSEQKTRPNHDVPWSLLLAIGSLVTGTLCLLRYNVFYTDGEVMQGLFTLLIGLVAGCLLIGFRNRRTAAWCLVAFGGSLVMWQAYQSRKWTIIHEDVVAIVHYAEKTKSKTGHYPSGLDGYVFKNPKVRRHIRSFEADKTGFRVTYFMNDTSISYWYSSKDGFGYYPD